MGDEADADWQEGLIEWGRQDTPTFRPKPGWLARQTEAACKRTDAMPVWKTNPPSTRVNRRRVKRSV